jgi:CRP-like cAMP-binding protein
VRKDAKLELIRSVPLFAHCKKKELAELGALADVVDVPSGTTLVREGDPLAREFMVIVSGTADVRRRGRKVASLGPGDFFGEMALLAHGPRTATVTATSPMELLVVTPQAFHGLLDDLPSLQRAVMQALAERLHAQAV